VNLLDSRDPRKFFAARLRDVLAGAIEVEINTVGTMEDEHERSFAAVIGWISS
jgi:hypothetical protein